MSNKSQTIGLKRNTIDKYYTSPSVVTKCIQNLKENIVISDNDLLIEPSAGNGSFINDLLSISCNCFFYDIKPEHPLIKEQDYLEFDVNTFKNQTNKREDAINFLKKAIELSPNEKRFKYTYKKLLTADKSKPAQNAFVFQLSFKGLPFDSL